MESHWCISPTVSQLSVISIVRVVEGMNFIKWQSKLVFFYLTFCQILVFLTESHNPCFMIGTHDNAFSSMVGLRITSGGTHI